MYNCESVKSLHMDHQNEEQMHNNLWQNSRSEDNPQFYGATNQFQVL